MKAVLPRIRSIVGWVWKHTAAGIAVVLIVAALIIGYRIGRPAPEPVSEVAAEAHDHGQDTGQPRMYTCSMHPSVRLPDPKAKCPICFMDLIPVAADEGEGNELRVTMSEAAAALSRIETAPVGRFFPTAEVRLYGKVTYDETSVARLTAYFPGRIERLFVNYVGVPVSAGAHMAEVYSPELLAAFEELRQVSDAAGSSRSGSELLRSATRDTLTAAREKLRLFGLTAEQIESVEEGRFDSDRLPIYAPMGGVVTHLAVRKGDYVQTGAPIATIANLSRLWLDMQAYESQLPLLRWGQPVTFTVEAHPGEVFEGRISFIEPLVGAQTRTAAVRVAVENKERRLKPGMFASAVVRTRVAQNGAVVNDELAGRWISPMHPTVVRDGPGQCDICGMDLVSAESLGVVGDPSLVEEPLVIPRSAVLFTGTRSVVYVEMPETERPTYEGRAVVLGPRAGDFYIVRGGLNRGERVVVNGAFRIDSAMQIAAKPSMMTPGGGSGGDPHAGHGGMAAGAIPDMEERVNVPDSFVYALKPVYAAYLDAQEALAADDLGGFSQAAADLRTAIGFVEEAGLVGEPLGVWRRAAAKLRVESGMTDIERARARFEGMSEAIIVLQRRFGHRGSEEWYIAHCPMALDNKGADWLQRGEQVNNPYFGASMLRCGDIRESFEPIDGTAMNGPMEGHDHE
ncbi:MAG: efflux RND transporter periplasmic adaptor subunit [Phycisphaerales bacterium]|nr:efflux RND transporter periplasmic adaptor subunit [Planctomycetota bacterium]MCH8507158.1 efflux RND transporter periplasmic adaptor subunit [Phycisphaerales bacterium]